MSTSIAKPQPWLKPVAIITGLLGFLLFVLTPFLPVNQTQASLQWPQNGNLNSVNAPLESYTPVDFHATVPVKAIDKVRDGQSLLLSTLPADSPNATARGLFVRTYEGSLEVSNRSQVLLQLNKDEIEKLDPNAVIKIDSTFDGTTATLPQEAKAKGVTVESEQNGDHRPIVSGIYTELEGNAASLENAGLHVDMEINSRFTSTPTWVKTLAMWVGAFMTVASLICLGLMDRLDGKKHPIVLASKSLRPRPLDGVVLAIIGFWYIFGANTSDDGFILTMARASDDSGYMANYYRWFGVPESPFGAPYYDLLGLMAKVSTASVWMRLPSLFAAIATWFVLSRDVLPRLGSSIDGRRVAHWTAAFVMLAFWLPYNNGLRPEPIIALGALLTWVSFEVAIANRRLLPAAIGTLLAAFTLACGPTGLMAVAALLAALSSVIRIVYRRTKVLGGKTWVSVAAMVAPFLAAGTAVLVAVFGDQTFASVRESITVRSAVGPSLEWYNEYIRYKSLFEQTVDGSFARRFAVLVAFVSIVVVLASMLRNDKVPGSNKLPSQRLMLMMLGTLFFLMFTPTKWTHHFGVWAGIGAALAALAAVAMSHMALRSARSRTLMFGAILFVFAFTLAGVNGWWYVSSYGVPWFDKTIQLKGIEASTVMLGISLLVLFIGTIQSFIIDVRATQAEDRGEDPNSVRRGKLDRFQGLAAAPIAVVCILAVTFQVLSFGKAFASQYPAYSVGLGNLNALRGQTCAMADYVLMETDTNESFLKPVDADFKDAIASEKQNNFEPGRVPPVLNSEEVTGVSTALANEVSDEDTALDASTSVGLRKEEGINGSRVPLPFGLDYKRVPILGSWTNGDQYYSEAISDWYEMPERSEDKPLLVVSAAGRIAHTDINDIDQYGQTFVAEYGRRDANGEVTELGQATFDDPGPRPVWRNLRLPLEQIPVEANVVRLHAIDASLDPDQWIAFTPPRVPTMDTLNNVVGSEAPVLMDWQVPLQFPCQRPFGHYAGVIENPRYRISPDHVGRITGSRFQDALGGGAQGPVEAIDSSFQLPSYAKDDWRRDWGTIEIYNPRTNAEGEAPDDADIDIKEVTRSGTWTPGLMNISVE
ncbi:arabinosyltransferase domain-containing protein [Corynebacterium pelargi]|uniref:Putative arabinosyltransferase C n=1 Tax=Corynebacterium pelargi TaxID=1471400 RepID=A0A410W5W6_9CORY|nr:arabinosyltransferase domain-containing protein [Corynebacterium pelargi]QAU51429.1 putative arabinosyltransferase C [Corynebacterium pelargi]GGG81018.1 arabinosyl transferase [Corynebacterium pelargi]